MQWTSIITARDVLDLQKAVKAARQNNWHRQEHHLLHPALQFHRVADKQPLSGKVARAAPWWFSRMGGSADDSMILGKGGADW
jgi:hypothetical protein